jgi:hypothetical protein
VRTGCERSRSRNNLYATHFANRKASLDRTDSRSPGVTALVGALYGKNRCKAIARSKTPEIIGA